MFIASTVAFAQQPELVLDDWDGNQYPTYEFNLWSNANCWCVWSWTAANPSTDGINTSDSCMYYPAHNWLDQTWWYYQEGMMGFKQLPTNYLQDYKNVYFEYLIGNGVSYAGVDTSKSSVGDTIRIKLKFAGASTDEAITTDVLHEVIITEDDLYVWKSVSFEIPEAVRNSDYTILNVFTGANPSKEMEIEFYYDNFGLDGYEGVSVAMKKPNDFHVFMSENQCNIRMTEPTLLNSVQIYNVAGSLIYQKTLNSKLTDFSFPVNLESGMYIVELNADNQKFTKKISK